MPPPRATADRLLHAHVLLSLVSRSSPPPQPFPVCAPLSQSRDTPAESTLVTGPLLHPLKPAQVPAWVWAAPQPEERVACPFRVIHPSPPCLVRYRPDLTPWLLARCR